jgi:hypothetical protein
MKRIDIIERLVAKGFSTNTLVKFNDNQLHKLSTKLLGEGLQVKADDLKNDPTLADKLKDLKDLKDKDVTIVPEEMDAAESIKKSPLKQKKSALNMKKLNAFVENVVDKKYHSLATKGDIVSLIKERMNEPVTNISEKTKGRLPEFMSFDSIVSAAEPQTKPDPKSPETIPSRPAEPRITPDQDPRRRPFRNPNEEPVIQPKPKAKTRILNKKMSMPIAAE